MDKVGIAKVQSMFPQICFALRLVPFVHTRILLCDLKEMM
jgi:hypothetical protein